MRCDRIKPSLSLLSQGLSVLLRCYWESSPLYNCTVVVPRQQIVMEQRTEEVEPPYSFVLCYRQLSVLKEGEHGSGWLWMSVSADVKAAAASTATAENIDRDQCV